MKHLISLILLFCINYNGFASHIVGGDFKVTMVNNGSSSSSYNIQLRLYRDDVNGLVDMPTSVSVGIYQVGTNALQNCVSMSLISSSIVPLGDPCYDPDPNVVRIEEGIYQTSMTVSLPNYSQGYYLAYETCCRNSLINNLSTPTSDGITIFAMIPDPSLGQNSSPDFGSYPLDAYFCVNNTKIFSWPVTDPDGDSLVYTLVSPMTDPTTFGTCVSGPGSGAYPYYPSCIFGSLYSLTNMIGGSVPFSIDPVTGEMTANPSIQGFFAFAVRVEEFRNGVKIGEVRRDAQYASLPCTISTPPIISVNNSSTNTNSSQIDVDVYVNDSSCFDFNVGVVDPADSVYVKLTSSEFDLLGTYVAPSLFSGGSQAACTHSFNMYDIFGDGWNGATVDIMVNGAVVASSITLTNGLNGTHNFNASSGDVITLSNWVSGTALGLYDYEISWDITDGNGLTIASGVHGDVNGGTASCPVSSTSVAYFDWEGTSDTTFFNPHGITVNGYLGNLGGIYLRYCWTVPCEELDSSFTVNLESYSISCAGTITTQADLLINVIADPPPPMQNVPNVFTPNDDGENDYFELVPYDPNIGVNNDTTFYNDPCFDTIVLVNIYNRWGQKVYDALEEKEAFRWDGNDLNGDACKSGSYMLIIKTFFGSRIEGGERMPNYYYTPEKGEVDPEGAYFLDQFPDNKYWIQLIR